MYMSYVLDFKQEKGMCTETRCEVSEQNETGFRSVR